MMAETVKNVLDNIAERESKYKTIEVHKHIAVEIDEGNLLAVDSNEIDSKQLKTSKEDYLVSLARDNCQLLINKIWELPITRIQETIVATLPEAKTLLPREKPPPKPKPETKWEKYAKLKGIQKKKKGRKVWDEELKEWRPTWGYKRANDPEREWVLEVPENADPMEDQFTKLRKEKKERVAKNELQRLRNIARNMKRKVPGVGLVPTEEPDKNHLNQAIAEARRSTASVGKFTDKLPKEKPAKNTGKKRKFEPNYGDASKEKKRMLNILNKVQSDKPTLDINKAVNQHIANEQQSRSAFNRGSKGKKTGKKKECGGKPSGGGGKRKGGKFSSSKGTGGKLKGKKGRK